MRSLGPCNSHPPRDLPFLCVGGAVPRTGCETSLSYRLQMGLLLAGPEEPSVQVKLVLGDLLPCCWPGVLPGGPGRCARQGWCGTSCP